MNTTVIIVMIGCATVIALVAIICDHCSDGKSGAINDECRLSKKVVGLHRNYIAGILGFAIIMLLTAKFGGPNSAIFEYLSFGSTITSLVLSILAIFVTVQSSSDLYKQFARIDNATDTINSVSKQIGGTLTAIQEAETKLASTSDNISVRLENIVEQIDEKIKVRIEKTEENISRQIAQNTSARPSIINPVKDGNSQDDKKYFIDVTSANGLLVLYSCALSSEKNKVFELSDLFKNNEAYSFGFLIASLSAKFLNFTNDTNNNQITCTSIVYSSEELYNAIKQRITQLNLGAEYVERLNNINSHFGIAPLILKLE